MWPRPMETKTRLPALMLLSSVCAHRLCTEMWEENGLSPRMAEVEHKNDALFEVRVSSQRATREF
jgi:hypothetical protein